MWYIVYIVFDLQFLLLLVSLVFYPYYYHYNFCHFQYQGLRLPPAAATTTTPASSTTTPRHPQFHPIVILTFDKLDSYLLQVQDIKKRSHRE